MTTATVPPSTSIFFPIKSCLIHAVACFTKKPVLESKWLGNSKGMSHHRQVL